MFVNYIIKNTFSLTIVDKNDKIKEKRMRRSMRTVRDWIQKFNNGEFEDDLLETQIEAGWYDWFCGQEELLPKLKKMAEIIIEIKNQYILDNYEIRLYNRYPIDYSFYDEISFHPLNQKENCFLSIKIDSPYTKNKYLLESWSIEKKKEWNFETKEALLDFLNNFKF